MQQAKRSWSDKYLTVESVSGLIGFVFAVGVLYSEFKGMKVKYNELEKEAAFHYDTQERRNDNRFQTTTDWNKERKKEISDLEERVRQLEKDISFEKGRNK
jgi:hypothetical protein